MKWQPIETAPKDGTTFWGEVDGDAKTMFWHDGFGEFVSSFNRMTMASGYTVDGLSYKDHSPQIHRPKFWCPKTEPPQEEELGA